MESFAGSRCLCSPCANTVSVSTGYAIDTCGNDIIVCSPDTVDICKLIKACTPTTQINCAPYKDLEPVPRSGAGLDSCDPLHRDAFARHDVSHRRVAMLLWRPRWFVLVRIGVSKACGCGSMMPAASCCGQTVVNTAAVSTNLPRRGAPPTCEPTADLRGLSLRSVSRAAVAGGNEAVAGARDRRARRDNRRRDVRADHLLRSSRARQYSDVAGHVEFERPDFPDGLGEFLLQPAPRR